MFDRLTIRGTSASILLGWHLAAEVRGWSLVKHGRRWHLAATCARLDAFQLRQRPLYFTAPHLAAGRAWGVESLDVVGPTSLRAILGPPE